MPLVRKAGRSRVLKAAVNPMSAVVEPGMHNFVALEQTDQIAAIKQLAAAEMSAYVIAAVTRLSVEQINRILGKS